MDPAPDFSRSAIAARCANHPDVAAIAVCARCGAFACAACHQVATDGRPYCARCLSLSNQQPLADRGARFAANLIDRVAIYAFLFVGIIPAAIADAAGRGEPSDEPSGWLLAGMGLMFLAPLAMMGVQLFMQATYGQSIGKRLLGIRVVRMNGGPVSLARIVFLRNVVPELINSCSGLFVLVDALFIFGAEQRCLHDMISDTKVVRVR